MKITSLHLVPALALVVTGLSSLRAADVAAMLKVGDKAPLVEGTNQDGRPWKLADEIGYRVVLLYFYPKDNTPGCTKEACAFRDSLQDLKRDKVEVFGVSFDSEDSHRNFIAKNDLNFPLIADTDGKIADAFGVRLAGSSMARRVSFLIGLDGKIVHVTDSPAADKHLEEMKAAIAKLEKK